jgi:hypothetical protein
MKPAGARGARACPRAFVAVTTVALASASCAAPLMKLPSGPGMPVSPAGAAEYALAEALNVTRCVRVNSLTAEIAVSGSIQGRPVRGRLSAGVADPGSARLEAIAPFGPPLFILTAHGADATLLLPRDNRVLRESGRPSAVLEAVAGVPVDAADLRQILTGCAPVFVSASGRTFGDTWEIISSAGYEVYLHRERATIPWALVATIRRPTSGGRGWRADFANRENGVPRSIRLVSLDEPGRIGSDADLRLDLSQVDVNTPLDDSVFSVQIPPDATPITIDDLRRTGPFASNAR